MNTAPAPVSSPNATPATPEVNVNALDSAHRRVVNNAESSMGVVTMDGILQNMMQEMADSGEALSRDNLENLENVQKYMNSMYSGLNRNDGPPARFRTYLERQILDARQQQQETQQ